MECTNGVGLPSLCPCALRARAAGPAATVEVVRCVLRMSSRQETAKKARQVNNI